MILSGRGNVITPLTKNYTLFIYLQELEMLFKRALAWESGEKGQLKLSAEKSGVYYFESTEGQGEAVGLLMEESLSSFREDYIKEKVPNCLGFQLVLLRVDEVCTALVFSSKYSYPSDALCATGGGIRTNMKRRRGGREPSNNLFSISR